MSALDGAGYLIDSNVLLDVINEDPQWIGWSANALAEAVRSGPTFINPLIYAEISVRYADLGDLEASIASTVLRRAALPYPAAFLAAKAHHAYRRRGGTRTATLPDFFIGAHAVVENLTLVTRDPRRYRDAFPTLRLITPG